MSGFVRSRPVCAEDAQQVIARSLTLVRELSLIYGAAKKPTFPCRATVAAGCRKQRGETREGTRNCGVRRDILGYLFQNYALIENATVAENLKVALTPRQSSQSETGTAVTEALDRVGLGGREKEKIYHLSGGEQQRVALARLMVKQPALVLADEPTGALDHANATMVVDILRQMSEAGCAVVIATHDDRVQDRCDSVFAVSKSSLVSSP